ncbi:hypothetical protein GCM10027445_12090 [Amycolatopsis endophytica]
MGCRRSTRTGRSGRRERAVLDVDNTRDCPCADRCSHCGGDDDLAVATYSTLVGVFCATVCPACVEYGPDALTWFSAAELVLAHCEHLGCDLDAMADALDMERRKE